MSKQALQKIIDQSNMFAGFRDEPTIDIDNLSTADAESLYETIDCGLSPENLFRRHNVSPENLHCDGEITRRQAQAKYNSYMQAVKELIKRGFAVPESCYEID